MKRKHVNMCGVIGKWLHKVRPTESQKLSSQHGKNRHISKNTVTRSRHD